MKYTPKQNDIDQFEKLLLESIKTIKSNQFKANATTSNCNYCYYAHTCPSSLASKKRK